MIIAVSLSEPHTSEYCMSVVFTEIYVEIRINFMRLQNLRLKIG